ncbi:MAG: hypothetical protein Q7U72_09290 [Brevundimonas sp.]|uniref:hypothetical protein n=1 Tax=Brevundimonas sp. TaxID=1871086 RepID=UPI0027213FA3|nr:hypothetical protein [Brevundimonas sp.]MDO9077628.1 hypothetical protein [Brevundimonas sp.]MDP3080910.1 hypothetical protein [Brevundimonas sp.]
MKKFLIPALALAAASVAVPAMAQSYGHQDRDGRGGYEQDRGGRYDNDRGGRYDNDRGGNWQNISQRKYQLDRRIDRGERNRQLSRREATRLRYELNALVNLERSYMRGGLSFRERAELDRRYDRLSMQVRAERRDNDNRRY